MRALLLILVLAGCVSISGEGGSVSIAVDRTVEIKAEKK